MRVFTPRNALAYFLVSMGVIGLAAQLPSPPSKTVNLPIQTTIVATSTPAGPLIKVTANDSFMYIDQKTFDEFQLTDQIGTAHLLAAGKIVVLLKGTHLLVLDVSGLSYIVRVQDGQHKDEKGIVRYNAFSTY